MNICLLWRGFSDLKTKTTGQSSLNPCVHCNCWTPKTNKWINTGFIAVAPQQEGCGFDSWTCNLLCGVCMFRKSVHVRLIRDSKLSPCDPAMSLWIGQVVGNSLIHDLYVSRSQSQWNRKWDTCASWGSKLSPFTLLSSPSACEAGPLLTFIF